MSAEQSRVIEKSFLARVQRITGKRKAEAAEMMAAFLCAGRSDQDIAEALLPAQQVPYQALDPGRETVVHVDPARGVERARVAIHMWGQRNGRRFSVRMVAPDTLRVRRTDGAATAPVVVVDTEDGIKFF